MKKKVLINLPLLIFDLILFYTGLISIYEVVTWLNEYFSYGIRNIPDDLVFKVFLAITFTVTTFFSALFTLRPKINSKPTAVFKIIKFSPFIFYVIALILAYEFFKYSNSFLETNRAIFLVIYSILNI